PYGIKFNSNFQWSTTSRDVRDGKAEHITREPEQVKAFRDTWREGIHSYLTYLRDRLTVARDLLTESGSIFVQIGDENVHRVRAMMDEVFGERNFITEIKFRTTSNRTSEFVPTVCDSILLYGRNREMLKFRRPFRSKGYDEVTEDSYGCVEESPNSWRRLTRYEKDNPSQSETIGPLFGLSDLTSSHEYTREPFHWFGKAFTTKRRYWSTSHHGLTRLGKANRLCDVNGTLRYKRFFKDTRVMVLNNIWHDLGSGSQTEARTYVVQTLSRAIQRCLLMTTDPGDLVLDPTCGSGTTAYVAEQWGRRWITIDTSRVALALARSRVMGARYPYFLLADSPQGQLKAAELSRNVPSETPTYGDIRQGFVYEVVPHITLKSIANNVEIDVIFEGSQPHVEAALASLNQALADLSGTHFLEWEVPREAEQGWNDAAREAHARFWEARNARQREIDACIAARAEYELLYDKPYQDNEKVRVAGPFTVESLSPHRLAALNENDELVIADTPASYDLGADLSRRDFAHLILENLRAAGVQQARKAGRITFSSLEPWPGELVCAEGRYLEGGGSKERRAGIFIGPEFGTVSRPDLVRATREAADAGFDALIACAFNYEAHATEFNKLGRVPVLKARMNADLHMAEDLKKTDTANLFVIFGEPDIDVEPTASDNEEDDWIQVRINGVDVFDPSAGEVRSDGPEGIACWFVDTDYNEESFFVRQAYFLGAGDPYKSLKTTLKAEIDPDAWATLHSDTSRPFPKPSTGRIAVKVINHLGDEVMKVFGV
ncbi:MAG: DNA methyltransferase, partial [Gammaproteobacteria bacterium]|nr:DNA methyltransferase [Gammaproteobacteria bacterium]